MDDLGVDVNEEQEADELAGVGGGDGNQHLGVAGGSRVDQAANNNNT